MTKPKWFTFLLRPVFKLVIVFAIVVYGTAFASKAKVVVIDIDYVIRKSNSYQSLKTALDKQHREYQREIAEYENEIIQLDKKIATEKNKLTENELSTLKNDLNKREIKIQRLVQQRRISLDESHSKQLEKIKLALLEIIQDESQKNGYQIILSRMNIVYNIPELDISDTILKKFNEKTKNE